MSIYTNSARFDGSARALTNDEIYKVAPSIFAETAHASRSDKFQPIPTIMVLEALRKEGFAPVGVKQARCRLPGRAEFTKHLIRLRRLDDDIKYKVGDNLCEILLKNANDGTSRYDIMAGLWRIRCLNSLVSQTAELDSLKVRHTGSPRDVFDKVIDGTFTVLETARNLLAAPQDWGQITLNPDQRVAYAEAAHALRFGDDDGQVATPIKATQLLETRRQGDAQPDLWSTFNVVQENALKGGLHGTRPDERARRGYRYVTTRAVKGIDQDIKLNKALWILTSKMSELAGDNPDKFDLAKSRANKIFDYGT